MGSDERENRAKLRRQRATLRKSTLGEMEWDDHPLSGEAAVSLVQRLTMESWSLTGKELPSYSRKDTPFRFVSGFPE